MFDAIKVKDQIVNWIRNWFDQNGPSCNAIIGISGGKDSTVMAGLCVEALGKDRVIGVSMPDKGQGLNDAPEICEYFGIRYIYAPIDKITAAFDEFKDGDTSHLNEAKNHPWSFQAKQNIPPRVRMTMLYAISQSNNGRVTNNCNMSEDWIGYSTRYGDSVGDFSPLCNLTVTEVRAIGHALGIPAKWVEKTPDDGLPGSSPDEVKFGFTYDLLDKYIRDGVEPENKQIKDKIDAMHKKNLFKLRYMDCFEYKPE